MVRVLLEDSRRESGRALLFENPQRLIVAHQAAEVPDALKEMEEAVEAGAYLAGFLSYELGYVLEPKLARLMPVKREVPLIWFGVFGSPQKMTRDETTAWLENAAGDHKLGDVSLAIDETDYISRVKRTQDLIAAGDIYQINLTFRSSFNLAGDPLGLYRELRTKQPVAYGAHLDCGEFSVVSASPEYFIKQKGKNISTRPMKGTAARASTLPLDRRKKVWLSNDEKSRAENLMIVDLMRNDLSRIAETGSVNVSDLYSIETHPTLHQMTSGIEATLSHRVSIGDTLRAIYPPGSITGAPKIRAMEVIRELEDSPRGVYTGTIGYFGQGNEALLNVAIRTAVIAANGSGVCSIGSGLVSDSDAAEEFAECRLKLRFLTDPVRDLQLIETLLLTPENEYTLRDRHLERLEQSAEYFAFSFDAETINSEMDEFARGANPGHHRVRLLLSPDGTIVVTGTPIEPPTETTSMSFVISDKRIDSTDPLFFHKTTQRDLYDDERAKLVPGTGCDEVIFFNERDELCEGTITNIFVELDGQLMTPSLKCGLLPGTLRAQMLDDGTTQEAVITREDFARATQIYLGNSVRGLVSARQLAIVPLKHTS